MWAADTWGNNNAAHHCRVSLLIGSGQRSGSNVSLNPTTEEYYEAKALQSDNLLLGPYGALVNEQPGPYVAARDWVDGLGDGPIDGTPNSNGYYAFDLSGVNDDIAQHHSASIWAIPVTTAERRKSICASITIVLMIWNRTRP